jgi:hypothetical protein
MTSRRKLEEEIARTKDPLVRKQLQKLLDKRKQRQDKTIKDTKEIGISLLREIDEAAPVIETVRVTIFIGSVIVLVVFFVVIFLEWIF